MLHNVASRKLLITILIILGSGTLISQVNIKERVEIKPKPLMQPAIEEAVLFADDPNPVGPLHVLVMHPCSVTASATIEMQGSPSSDLYVKTLVAESLAGYNGHYVSPPQIGSNPVTFRMTCGMVPIKLESTWEGIDIRSIDKTITSNSATFVIQGMLSRCSYTVTAQLQATYDDSYDLAVLEMTTDDGQITQCYSTTMLHLNARNRIGDWYTPITCQGPPEQLTLSVESDMDVRFDYFGELYAHQFNPPGGLSDMPLRWVYKGETQSSTATITLSAGGQTVSKQINLVVVPSELKLTFGKDMIRYGESTTITAEALIPNGEASPVPSGWNVAFWTLVDDSVGFLYSQDSLQEGQFIDGFAATANFYAKSQSSAPDSLLVPVRAMAWKNMGGPALSVRQFPKLDSVRKWMTLHNNEQSQKATNVEGIGNGNPPKIASPAMGVEPCNYLACMDTLVVKKTQQLDHFDVLVLPDSLAHSECSTIRVLPKDKLGENVIISDGIELNFLLSLDGQKYGRLSSPGGSGPIVNISFEDVKKGELKYFADGEYAIGDSALQIEISVVKGDDKSKSGTGNIYLRPAIEPFCQNDGRWADTQYDLYVRKKKDGRTDSTNAQGSKVYYRLSDRGCALACMAMIAHAGGANTDPGKLANRMNEPIHYGFSESHGVLWRTVDSLEGNSRYRYDNIKGDGLKYKSDKKTIDVDNSQSVALDIMDEFLGKGALIVAQVYNPTTKNQHFVLVVAKRGEGYQIIDAGCYRERTILSNGYSNKVYKIVIYRKI